MKRVALLAFLLAVALPAAASGQGRAVFFTSTCGNSVYEPDEIVLTCADHAAYLKTPFWDMWGENTATTLGTLVYPDPSCRVVVCPRRQSDEVRVTLRRVVPCQASRSWQFTRMYLHDLDGDLPEGVQARRAYQCSDFAPAGSALWEVCEPPRHSLFYSLKVRGTSCATGRRVLTHGRCVSAGCGRTRWGPWRCHTGRSVSDRAKYCRRGEKRVVGRASGD